VTDAALPERLRDVYWIGGGSGAGKSTVARRLAGHYGLPVYATDDVMPDHARRMVPADSPFLAEFAAMDMDERWVSRSPETMLVDAAMTEDGLVKRVAEAFGLRGR
jgi:adenylate kinase family enzyme